MRLCGIFLGVFVLAWPLQRILCHENVLCGRSLACGSTCITKHFFKRGLFKWSVKFYRFLAICCNAHSYGIYNILMILVGYLALRNYLVILRCIFVYRSNQFLCDASLTYLLLLGFLCKLFPGKSPCNEWGRCAQTCMPSRQNESRVECGCVEGFHLGPNQVSCLPLGKPLKYQPTAPPVRNSGLLTVFV